MIWFWLALQLGTASPVWASTEDEAMVDVAQIPDNGALPDGWKDLEGKLGTPQGDAALEDYLKRHPGGLAASRAYLEKARRSKNLLDSAHLYKESYDQDPDGPWARIAILEAGKQDYALQRPEEAYLLFSKINDSDFEGENLAQLRFWRAQSLLLMRSFGWAQDDFENFERDFPNHSLADEARLGIADCDLGLGHLEAALEEYQKLYEAPASSVAPDALRKAALMESQAGHAARAAALAKELQARYPNAFEVDGLEASFPKPNPSALATPLPTKPIAPRFTIQVGIFSRRVWAEHLYKTLKQRGYPVRLDRRNFNDSICDVVQVGSYPNKPAALKAAQRLKRREHCEFLIVEASLNP